MKAKSIARWGILAALALVMSGMEELLALPFLPPGAKPGLSNLVTMASLVVAPVPAAFFVTVIKALFALLTRGLTAFLLSLSGGLVSCTATALLYKLAKKKLSWRAIGMLGAFCHNACQLAAAVLWTGTPSLWYYAPALILCAGVAGLLTGEIMEILSPYLEHIKER